MKKENWEKLSPKNILVRMPNWVGDVVMATPILTDICHRWPEAKVTAMCQSNIAPLLQHDPHLDELFSFQRPSGWLPHQQHWNIIKTLRQGQYDLGVLLTNSLSSAWWFWIGNVKNRIGFAGDGRNLLLNKSVPFPEERNKQHLVLTYKSLLQPLGIPISKTEPALYLTQEERDAAHELFKKCGAIVGKHTIVGINPGAAFGSAKCWLPDRFSAVTRCLLEDPNTYVVYFGDASGASLVNGICKDMPDRVINLAGKTTLRELMACIQSCTVVMSNDSGPMHMAAALKIPVLGLFGSTSDLISRPYGIGRVIHKHVECSPCFRKTCPIDFRCMTRIEVDEVYQTLLDMIAEVHRSKKG